MSTGKKGPSCCQSRTCKSSLYRGRPLTSPTVQGPSDRPVTRQAAAWHAGKAFFARNPCKFQIFQHQIKYFSNQNQILEKFFGNFSLACPCLCAHLPCCLVLFFMPSAEEPALLYVTICLRALALWGVVRPAMLDLAVVGAYEWYCNCLCLLALCFCMERVINGCYLVDPASSHMLVSKIKPCMFKKLVVGPWVGLIGPPLVCTGWLVPSAGDALLALIGRVVPPALRTTAKAFAKDVFINQERKLGARRRSDTVLVSTINDADQGSADVAFRTPLAPYEKSKSLGSGGSMVARLKLKGIDGRAPPGVEPAA
ncbi:hypothetical protein KIW84_UN0563 [Lathyrus oleraceus]|nr:hypothetical protein KIW84_UN0557 [Pisum sativum]KAI5381647.1 hypothetical protein KIW84_UN0559 [Pisum sativum]KAI5381649.1 hypothetical protein KIW84_UN0561 [Pisum sativum]KAI5381651.1 hypothetical protein KIW84_UN0563 [Pisum sativum]